MKTYTIEYNGKMIVADVSVQPAESMDLGWEVESATMDGEKMSRQWIEGFFGNGDGFDILNGLIMMEKP